ncbi:MAG: agmatinase [Chloroflexota bacterium]
MQTTNGSYNALPETLPLESNFLAIEEEYSNYKNSQIAIISAPFEQTVSYGGGAEYGPEAILKASAYVEFYDEEFERELCNDRGIATLAPIDFGEARDLAALEMIESQCKRALDDGKFVVTLGGEHTISFAPIRAHYEKYPEMSVLHFDAHSDLRVEYEGSPYSHACVMSRVADFFPPERITQIGIRAQCKEEAQFIRERKVNTFFAYAIRRGDYGADWVKKAVATLAKQVYITFDVDCFDPSIMPTTGTPEPNGLLYEEALAIFREIVASGREIIGFDVVELAPVEGIHHTDLTTARLVYKLLNVTFSNK